MNLSPQWVEIFRANGWEAVHWTEIGSPHATDRTIMRWAASNGYSVFTHDLDFGALLAATQAAHPSVVQIRVQAPLPETIRDVVLSSIRALEREIDSGALITIEPQRARVRILPLYP